MKKKSTILFALLFVFTLALSFGVSSTIHANASPCCVIPGGPYCQDSGGHWVENPLGHQFPEICVNDGTNNCDYNGNCY